MRAGRALSLVLAAAGVILVLAPLAAPAQNLGRLALLSRLGEPLDAEIEITAVPLEARDTLSAQIVPIGVFERFGVTPSPSLEVVRATVERGADGRPMVRLKSTVPVERPTVNVIIELRLERWADGQAVFLTSIRPSGRSPADPHRPPRGQAPQTSPAPKARPRNRLPPRNRSKAQEKVVAKTDGRAHPPLSSERDVAAAEGRVKDLERTMRELQRGSTRGIARSVLQRRLAAPQ
jgi:pilus assembly protein FimV